MPKRESPPCNLLTCHLSVTDSESSKVQQYLRMRDGVAPETYCMAPYLRAVAGRRQRKAMAQLRAGSHWLGVESGRREGAALPRDQRVCQRCGSGEVDDEAHMVFRCAALSVQRREYASLFITVASGPPRLHGSGPDGGGSICICVLQEGPGAEDL